MYYYGLDFHDPFLNISMLIVVCEAFLRIPPHFGLWLKTFNVKTKVVGGQHAECGGAMVSNMPNVTWPSGTFNESVKGRQQQWFYVTEPHDTTWVVAPEFRFGSPMQLTSWPEKGRDWSLSDELTALQARIKSMGDKNIKLVNVVQVMLVRRILPCQSRTCHLWEFDPAKHHTLLEFFGTMHEVIWKVLFKPNKTWPDTAEDRGHNLACPASPVSLYMFSRCTLYSHT